MNVYKITLFAALFMPILLKAQLAWVPIGADAWATGTQSVTRESVFGSINNPATIAYITNYQIGLYQELRYRQPALTLSALATVLPGKFLNMGFGLVQQGTNKYNQQKVNCSLAKKLGSNLSMGLNISFLGTNIAEQNYKSNFLTELGLLYKSGQNLQVGAYIFNPTLVKMKGLTQEPLPAFLRVGFSYKFSQTLKILGELEHKIVFGNTPKFGFEYNPVNAFTFYAGWSQNPQFLSFGSAFQSQNFKIMLAASRHEVLGITPHFSMVYQFKNKAK